MNVCDKMEINEPKKDTSEMKEQKKDGVEAEDQKKDAAETKEHKKAGMNVKYALAAVVIIALVCVTYLKLSNAASPVVAAGDVINVSYTGTFTNGTVFDTNVGKQQMQFTVGAGQLIKGFDQAVVGMRIGENKTITLPPSEAYGEVNSSLVIPVPSNILGNTTLQLGMMIDRKTGMQEEQGTVIALNNTTATINFNPPLAGKTLVFNIKVLAIRKP